MESTRNPCFKPGVKRVETFTHRHSHSNLPLPLWHMKYEKCTRSTKPSLLPGITVAWCESHGLSDLCGLERDVGIRLSCLRFLSHTTIFGHLCTLFSQFSLVSWAPVSSASDERSESPWNQQQIPALSLEGRRWGPGRWRLFNV
jgi:hypothetical protein